MVRWKRNRLMGRIGKGGMRRRAREMDKGDGDALSI